MKESERKSGLFVVPGTQLGVIEEFTPGPGTYVEDGTIHSQVTGCTLLDMLNIVTGLVVEVRSKNAILRIFKIGDKMLSGFFTGMLHISGVSHGYVDNMFNVCKVGDIMTAKVISTKNRSFFLSTADKDLGVIQALCSICGSLLEPKNRGMGCSNCGNFEGRKLSPNYGKEVSTEEKQNES
jgi:exosome complex component CSL4